MSHVDDGQLNALLDNELPAGEKREVEAHLAGCAECARRLEEARAFLAEAGELLAVLTPSGTVVPQAPPVASVSPVSPVSVTKAEAIGLAPLSRGPAASESTRKSGDRASEPAIAKTSKEIAINIDGRTAMTPAIRPVTRRGMPAVPDESLRPLNLEKLAWAASLVLALGVGYLANEVYRLKNPPRSSEVAVATDARPASPAAEVASSRDPLQRAPAPANAPARQSGSALSRTNPPTQPRRDASAGPSRAGAEASKPPGARASKPAPSIARPADALAGAPLTSPAQGASGTGALSAADRGRSAERRAEAPAPPTTLPRAMAAAPAATNRLDEVAVTRLGDAAAASFRRITLEDAVRRLSGSIRLVDGMQPSRVEAGPGRLVQGADPERDIVRITYTDARGSRIVLDQQIGDVRTGSFNGLMQGDTLVTSTEVGGTRVRWVDRKFWLSLTGAATADSVRALVERVR